VDGPVAEVIAQAAADHRGKDEASPEDRIRRNSIDGCHYSARMTYGVFGKFSAQPGRRDELVTYLLQAAKLLERNPGCIHYIVSTSDEPESVWVCEVWTSVAAHDSSLEPEDIRALIQEARPLIAGMSDQTRLAVQGGKGLPG
jgi:quinol monooxygenase YgiN